MIRLTLMTLIITAICAAFVVLPNVVALIAVITKLKAVMP